MPHSIFRSQKNAVSYCLKEDKISLIDLTIGNNATADSVTVLTYWVSSVQWVYVAEFQSYLHSLIMT